MREANWDVGIPCDKTSDPLRSGTVRRKGIGGKISPGYDARVIVAPVCQRGFLLASADQSR